MDKENKRILRDWDDHLTQTLKDNYALVEALPRVPVCVACPMAQWYKLEAAPPSKPDEKHRPPTLECFCTAYRCVMYNGARAVTACDARKDALQALPDPHDR